MPTFNLCMKMHMLKAEYVYGAPYMAMDMAIEGAPSDPTYTSELIAWDIAKGKAFGLKEPSAIYGGVLSTAGNLVFYGTQDKVFKAIDARPEKAVNGVPKVLWSTKMECSTVGNPITFTVGQANEQRIAVFSGVGAMAGGFGGGACTGSAGGKVHVYKLK